MIVYKLQNAPIVKADRGYYVKHPFNDAILAHCSNYNVAAFIVEALNEVATFAKAYAEGEPDE